LLVGRAEELAAVRDLLAHATLDGACLVLSGEPGIGKTALLDEGQRLAAAGGFRVLRASGVEFLADLGFSTLSALLQPIQAGVDDLDPGERDALGSMLGLGGDAPTHRAAGHEAVLALLRRVAEEAPLLVVLDDAHWADRASVEALAFVARRVQGSRIGLLAAFRPGVDDVFGWRLLPRREVPPLPEAVAAALLADRHPELERGAARQVLHEAAGNPLALIELPAALSTQGRRTDPTPAAPVLPLTRRLQALYSDEVEQLPAASRDVLLVAALEGAGDVALSLRAVEGRASLYDLAPAERAGLVRVDDATERVHFRHPLIRATVIELAPPAQRAWAHGRLAWVLQHDPVRQALHLAAAAQGTDESVAALLEGAARALLRRGDAVGAFRGLLRAADLTPDVEARSRRLAEAAYVSADVTGEPRVAAQLLVEARRGDPQLRSSLRAAVAAAYLLLTGDGDVTAAYRLLLEALHRATLAGEEEAVARGQAIMTLLEICLYGSRPELWPSFLDVRARLDGSLPPVLRALVQVLGDPAGVTAADVALLEGQIEALEDETSPTVIQRVATAAVYLDRAVDCRPALWRVVEDGRAGGAVGSGINAALVLGADAWHAGEWDLAVSVSEEAIRVCEQQGYDLLRWPLLLNLGCIAAARGDAAAVRATVTQMDAWAAPRGVGAVSMYARHLGLLDALGRADHEAAVHHAQALCRPGELAGRSTNVLWATLDWVEATAFTGRRAAALVHVAAVQSAGITAHAPRLTLLTRAAAALVAAPEEADDRFEQALAVSDVRRWPFDSARVHLLYGEHLRAGQRYAEAEAQLAAAADVFRDLGAQPWEVRAAAGPR
jgi:tetratricopeptide (TPR) repeat protein